MDSQERIEILPTDDEYRQMAADALAKVPDAASEAERFQLRRAGAAYLKLAAHRTEVAARAAAPKARRIAPEKPPATKTSGLITRGY